MTNTVIKTTCPLQTITHHKVPLFSRPIKVAIQHGLYTIWWICPSITPTTEYYNRTIGLYPTSPEGTIPYDISSEHHIDTIFESPYVWHFFDLGTRKQ